MGLADYNKKFDFKDFFYLFLIVVSSELTLLLAFMLDKHIRIQMWKYSILFDVMFFLLLIINKKIKSNIIYTIATFFTPAFRTIINIALIILIRKIGFNINWFILIVFCYISICLFVIFPSDKLDEINKFFLNSKIAKIGLLLVLIFLAFDNNRYIIRYKIPGSFRDISGAIRLGVGLLVLNYYLMILAITTIKNSLRQFTDEKLRKKGFVEEL